MISLRGPDEQRLEDVAGEDARTAVVTACASIVAGSVPIAITSGVRVAAATGAFVVVVRTRWWRRRALRSAVPIVASMRPRRTHNRGGE